MKLVYFSRTGNVESFVHKLNLPDTFQIESGNETLDEPFVIITFTDGYGELPEEVETFLENNAQNITGVASSGDKSYGDAYCLAADLISDTYGVPILGKFEFDGTDDDVKAFLDAFSALS